MSKKHFILAARFIKLYVEAGQIAEAKAAAIVVINMNDNGNFDKGRFLAACGLDK
jgi:hypothetical protein